MVVVIFIVLYFADKTISLPKGIRARFSNLIFGFVAAVLSYKAFVVVTKIMQKEKLKVGVDS